VPPKLSYANVMSTLCFFLLLGGGAYAAGHLGKNSVGTKQLKKNSVTTAKVKKNAITGAKVKKHTLTGSDINVDKLGKVPAAGVADTANGLAAPEAIHIVGTQGEPPFLDGSTNFPPEGAKIQPVGFYKDRGGIVHLEGAAKVGGEENPLKGLIFTLPPGDRPASGTINYFPTREGDVFIYGSDVTISEKNLEGAVQFTVPLGGALLSGISFRAQS
jgi:hypothetical protein